MLHPVSEGKHCITFDIEYDININLPPEPTEQGSGPILRSLPLESKTPSDIEIGPAKFPQKLRRPSCKGSVHGTEQIPSSNSGGRFPRAYGGTRSLFRRHGPMA